MQSRYKKIFAFILMVLWMGVIFYFSAQVASNSSAQSSRVVDVIKSLTEKIAPSAKNIGAKKWHSVETIVRKIGHGAEYFILGVLCTNFILRCKSFKLKKTVSATICFLYALSDEIHQLFVPGRSGQISDVLIDFTGSILGVLVFVVVIKILDGRRRT